MTTDSTQRIISLMETLPFFQFLHPETLQAMVPLGELRAYAPGDLICTEGEQDDTFFLIAGGECAIYRMKDGEQSYVATLGAEDFFGEIALTSGGLRTATVQAATDVHLVAFPGAPMRSVLQYDPNLQEFLVSVRRAREESNLANA